MGTGKVNKNSIKNGFYAYVDRWGLLWTIVLEEAQF